MRFNGSRRLHGSLPWAWTHSEETLEDVGGNLSKDLPPRASAASPSTGRGRAEPGPGAPRTLLPGGTPPGGFRCSLGLRLWRYPGLGLQVLGRGLSAKTNTSQGNRRAPADTKDEQGETEGIRVCRLKLLGLR